MVIAVAAKGGVMTLERDARIRERAYHIWLAEGRIAGRHDEHWHRAEREIANEEAPVRQETGVRSAAAGARRPRTQTTPKATKQTAPSSVRRAAPSPAKQTAATPAKRTSKGNGAASVRRARSPTSPA
jgi:hypothetical protein